MSEIKLGSTGNWERVNVNGHNSRSHHGSLECCSNKLQGQPSGGGGFAGVGGGLDWGAPSQHLAIVSS